MATIILLCAVLGGVGYLNSTAAGFGILGLIFTSCGHASRITSALLYSQKFNWHTLLFTFCGLASASVLYKHNFEILTYFKVRLSFES